MSKERTVEEIITGLEEKYKGDEEVLEMIEDEKENIEYLQEREKEADYDGQTAIGSALEFEGHLETWFPQVSILRF